MYRHGKLDNRLKAKALFRKLREKVFDASGVTIEIRNRIAAGALDHWRLSNVDGVHIFSDADGWHCDIVFKDLPLGVPQVCGNSGSLGNREEAIEFAIKHLSLVALNDKLPKADVNSGDRYFRLDNIEVPVSAAMLNSFPADLAAENYTQFKAFGRLAQLRHDLNNDEPFTVQSFKALDASSQARLTIACGIAMALGINKFTPETAMWSDFDPEAPQVSGPRM